MKRIGLAVAIMLAALPALAQDAVGNWGGLLAGSLHILVRVNKDGAGQYVGTLESPDQDKTSAPLAQVSVVEGRLSFTVPKVNGRYAATWDAAQQAWVGTWTQGQPLPFRLERLDAKGVADMYPQRPQEEAIAKGNWPYTTHAVSFDSTAAGVKLAGSYSVPKGPGPFPAVVLVAGSGPNTRDEDVFGHKVLLVLADALNRAGVAVLRYDKRGIGGSTGAYRTATTADFADDARAALAYLGARAEVDPKRVGVVGHSEGGSIAPMLAADSPNVAFVVMLAGTGVNGEKLLLSQQALTMRAAGVSEAEIALSAQRNQHAFAILANATSDDDARQQLKAWLAPLVASRQIPQSEADGTLARMLDPWMRHFLRFDPAPVLEKVKQPVLVLNGTLDLQVAPADNLPAIRQALRANRDATIVEMPGLNHLFQSANTGSPTEYAGIAQTMSPAALNTITTWVVQRAKP